MPNDENKKAKSKSQQPMQRDATAAAVDWRSVAPMPTNAPLSVEDPRAWQGLQIPQDPRMAVTIPQQRQELYVDRFYGVPPYMGPMQDMGPNFPGMVSRMTPVPRQASTMVAPPPMPTNAPLSVEDPRGRQGETMPIDKNKKAKGKSQQPPAPPVYLPPVYGKPIAPYPMPDVMPTYVDPLSAQVEDFVRQTEPRAFRQVTPPELSDKFYHYYYPNKRGDQPFTAQDSSEVEGFLSQLLPQDQAKARIEAIRAIMLR